MPYPPPLLKPVNGRDSPDIDVPRIQSGIRRLKSEVNEINHNFKDLRGIYTDKHVQYYDITSLDTMKVPNSLPASSSYR